MDHERDSPASISANPAFQSGLVNGMHMNGLSERDLEELERELPVVDDGQVCHVGISRLRTC